MEQRYHHPNMRRYIDNFACKDCQKHKLDGKRYGLLPMRDLKEQPFEEVAVDLMGPWKVQVRGRSYEFNALTVIKVSGSTKIKPFEQFLFIPVPTQDTGSNLVQ